jgi:hypothetical protein
MCCLVFVNLKNLTSLTGHFLLPRPFGTNRAGCQHDIALVALSDKLESVRQRHSASVAGPVRHLRLGALLAT